MKMNVFVCSWTLLCFCGIIYASHDNNSKSECSKFDFEEKVLEKLVRIEHKIEIQEKSIDKWKTDLADGLATIENMERGMCLIFTGITGICQLFYF